MVNATRGAVQFSPFPAIDPRAAGVHTRWMMVPAARPRFCTECGASLPDGAKFCAQCGTRVELETEATPPPVPDELREKYESARAELRGERRQVAVLFADVAGYTSYSESLDPEEVSFFMHGLLRDLADVVYRYEGHVDKFMGDAVMALFGAPIAHENDPERAALAGLAMLETVERRSDESGVEIGLRVGINLGVVVAGEVGSGEGGHYTVMGDAVNVASRLESAAEPGTVLASEEIHRRIAARFETEEVPPLELKGKSGLIRAFRIVSYRPSTPHRVRSETPFVGREKELAAIGALLDRLAAGESGALVLEADAGMGKSRLVAEALGRAGDFVRRIDVAFQPIRLPSAVSAPAELFRALFPGGGTGAVGAALDLLGETEEAHRAGVLGLAREADPEAGIETPPETDPETARRNRWLAIVALLERSSRMRPVALVVDDVHWADEASAEFLLFLLDDLPAGTAAILATRPGDEADALPEPIERLHVSPLGEAEVRTILGPLWDEMSPVHRRALVERSQGNPFFFEELVRAMREGGDPERVPGTLQGLIRARIDRLAPPVQALLQMAAVLGPRFPEELLARMWALDARPMGFGEAMAALEEGGFLSPVTTGEERRFVHALTQEVAYHGLLKRIRRVLHESAARIGEEVYHDRRGTEAAFFAHHYWEAGLEAEAAPHLWSAGKAAAEGFDLAAAETFLRRAGRAIDPHPDILADPEARAELFRTTGFVLVHRGALDEAEEWFDRLESLGEREDRPGWKVRAIDWRGRIAWFRGRLDEAGERFAEGLAALSEEGGPLAADLHNDLGMVAWYRGDPDAAERHHRTALSIREAEGDLQGQAKSHINLGNVRVDLAEDLDGAERHYERARTLAERVGDRQLIGSSLGNLGRIAMERGAWDDAITRFRDARERAEEIGHTLGRYLWLQNQAFCETWLGRIDDAVRRLEVCRQHADDVFEPVNRVNTRLYLFEAWHRALDDERAGEALAAARRIVDELGVDEMEDEVRLDEGRLLAGRGAWEEAEEAFAEAARAAARLHHPSVEKLARAHRCRAAARARLADPEPCPEEEVGGRRPVGAVVRYLSADVRASRDPSAGSASALEEAAAEAERLSDPGLERAAFERAAWAWEAAGEPERARRAAERALAAARALTRGLPEEIRDAFLARARDARPIFRARG